MPNIGRLRKSGNWFLNLTLGLKVILKFPLQAGAGGRGGRGGDRGGFRKKKIQKELFSF